MAAKISGPPPETPSHGVPTAGELVRRGTVAAVLLIALVKLWLTSGLRILAVYAPHDASNFVSHARTILAGAWFGRYDDLTLIKGPVFPLYLAGVQELGLSLPLAHQLIYLCASLIACAAVAPIVRGRIALLALFVAVFFDPFTYSYNAVVANRSQLTETLALVSFACAAAIFIRRREPLRRVLPWFAGLAVAFAAFWLTREEGVWLVPALSVLAAAYLWAGRSTGMRGLAARGALVAVPIVAVLAAIGAVSAMNYAKYGWFTAVEMQSPEFVSAYNSLARIEAVPRPHVPVTHAAREIAYRASPAAAELEPAFERGVGKAWMGYGCEALSICGDIGAGWFMWALRDTVAATGHYAGGAEARDFYVRLSRELDQACDTGRIRCRAKGRTLAPPLGPADLPLLGSEFLRGAQILATFSQFDIEDWTAPPRNPEMDELYAFVVRDIEGSSSAPVFNGWLTHGPVRSIAVLGPAGTDSQATITFKPSADVYRALPGSRFVDRGVARFTITAGSCADACSLEVLVEDGARVVIPLALSVPDLQRAGLHYHLDSVAQPSRSRTFDDVDKRGLLRRIGRLYGTVLPFAAAIAFVLTAFRALRARRRDSLVSSEHAFLAASIALSASALLLILSIIDAFSFPAFIPEYMGGLYPLVLFGVATTLAVEGQAAYRLVRIHAARPPA